MALDLTSDLGDLCTRELSVGSTTLDCQEPSISVETEVVKVELPARSHRSEGHSPQEVKVTMRPDT